MIPTPRVITGPTIQGSVASSGPPSSFDRLDRVAAAALEAIAYGDVFGWPLTAAEVHRFLPLPAGPLEVESALVSLRTDGWVCSIDRYFILPGQNHCVEERRRRGVISARLWPKAIRYVRYLSRLPWVRLVAVSGSLAVHAADDDADIDLFMVTDDGRLWLTRALTIGVAKLAARATRRQAIWLCPNYLLGSTALEMTDRDLFTAHELAQLVPLCGPDVYRALLAQNEWYRQFLPNHPGYPGPITELGGRRVRHVVEPVMRNRVVERVEAWEMRRKVARLSVAAPTSEVRFDESICKGHFGQHRRRALSAFANRMARLKEAKP